ncbi:MAG TPA: hypothetical protein PKK94_28145, partial [Leptospiraceae bacterium]|nr:hypothetical protein [Leptospiraceae bacterium]
RGRSSIRGTEGESPEKTEYAALGTFVADNFEIDFALSKKLGDRNFVIVYDSNPDWDGGETVKTPKTEKKKKSLKKAA